MIIPPAVSTVAQLISGLVSSANSARDLASKISDHALKGAVSKLCDEILDVKIRVLELDQENRYLKAALAQKDEVVGPLGPKAISFTKTSSINHCAQSASSQYLAMLFFFLHWKVLITEQGATALPVVTAIQKHP